MWCSVAVALYVIRVCVSTLSVSNGRKICNLLTLPALPKTNLRSALKQNKSGHSFKLVLCRHVLCLSLCEVRCSVPKLVSSFVLSVSCCALEAQITVWLVGVGESGSSVSIVSGYGLDNRAIEVRSSAGANDSSCSLCVQTGSGAHPASCPMSTGVLSLWGGRDADHSPPSSAEVENE
jgi:hypothetical protein